MEILLSGTKFYQQDIHLLLREKMETDEKIVRKALVKVWTKVLEKYARPGAVIPPAELLRKELYDAGVDAAINAVVDEHWFVFSFMIREEVEMKLERGLRKFDLAGFIEDVKAAQKDPGLIKVLTERLKDSILHDEFCTAIGQ